MIRMRYGWAALALLWAVHPALAGQTTLEGEHRVVIEDQPGHRHSVRHDFLLTDQGTFKITFPDPKKVPQALSGSHVRASGVLAGRQLQLSSAQTSGVLSASGAQSLAFGVTGAAARVNST